MKPITTPSGRKTLDVSATRSTSAPIAPHTIGPASKVLMILQAISSLGPALAGSTLGWFSPVIEIEFSRDSLGVIHRSSLMDTGFQPWFGSTYGTLARVKMTASSASRTIV